MARIFAGAGDPGHYVRQRAAFKHACGRPNVKIAGSGFDYGFGSDGAASRKRIIDDPGILGAAALARIDDQRALIQRDPRQPARHDAHAIRAGEHEGPQIDMARRDAGIERRSGRSKARASAGR